MKGFISSLVLTVCACGGEAALSVTVGIVEPAEGVHFTVRPITEASVMGSVGNTLAELKQAVELVSRGTVTTVVDRTLRLDEFQQGIDALTRSEPVGRVVLLP